MLLGPTFVIVLFFILLLVAIVVSVNVNSHDHFTKSKMNTFITIISGSAIFMTFIFYYNIVELQRLQNKDASIAQVVKLNRKISEEINEEMNNAIEKIPNFVLSLNPLLKYELIPGKDENTFTSNLLKESISYKIFSIWENYIISESLIHYDEISYISNFLQKTKSLFLKEIWEKKKFCFPLHVQKFGDLLFEYSNEWTEIETEIENTKEENTKEENTKEENTKEENTKEENIQKLNLEIHNRKNGIENSKNINLNLQKSNLENIYQSQIDILKNIAQKFIKDERYKKIKISIGVI